MIVCQFCACGADRVKCVVEMVRSGYTAELPCETSHVMEKGVMEGRPKNMSAGKNKESTFPQGRAPARLIPQRIHVTD